MAEEAGGEVGHDLAPFGCGCVAVGDQRRTGADMDDLGALQAGAQAADEERDIGALAAAVGVELVEDEEEGSRASGRGATSGASSGRSSRSSAIT